MARTVLRPRTHTYHDWANLQAVGGTNEVTRIMECVWVAAFLIFAASRYFGVACRDFAVASPHLYELMYGPRVRELLPSPDDRDDARRLQTIVAELFVEAQEEGQFRKSNPADLSRIFWAALHGSVSLELTNWFTPSEGEQRFDQLITIVLDGEAADPDRDSGDTSAR